MIEVLQAAREVQDFLEQREWSFAFLGGIAVNRWGRARMTNDADLCLFTDFGNEASFIDALLEKFTPRRSDAKEFALLNRVVLLTTKKGFGVDISLGAFDFERSAILRGSLFRFPEDVELLTVSAEDLVVFKAFAGRPQDWFDVEGIFNRQWTSLDMNLIRKELTPLCELKESPETLDQLERLWQSCQDA
jgi:hypothetical protein